jgi:uncharacterized protein YndB with AHSA1/START domain
MAHPFELSYEIDVDASPKEVWEAIATGPGVDSWFMGRNEIEPREGGTTRMDFGSGSTEESESTVTAWEPPTRFASRTPQGEDGARHMFEYLVEGRDQGSTVVRWVHSGFLGQNWEKEYEGMSEGDPMYFDKLRVYLTYFRGRTATPVHVYGGPAVPDRDEAWERFHGALGLPGPVALGDSVHSRGRASGAARRRRLALPGLPRGPYRRRHLPIHAHQRVRRSDRCRPPHLR